MASTEEPARTLILFAHPSFERARISPALLARAAEIPGVSIRDLYGLYPDSAVDVHSEQAALAAHDLIVLQFPLHWYSTPALLKEWLDLVLTHNWAYGKQGRALEDKVLACSVSAGGSASDYRGDGPNRYTIAEFLRPLEQTALLCRMRWRPPFVVFDAATLSKTGLRREAGRYGEWLVEAASRNSAEVES